MDTAAVQEAIFQGLLLRESVGSTQLSLEFLEPHRRQVEMQWDAAVEREKASRSLFAQRTIKVEEVARELADSRDHLGDEASVERFTLTCLRELGAHLSGRETIQVDLAESPRSLRDLLGVDSRVAISFRGSPSRHVERLTRTHPFVEGLATHVLESALDRQVDGGPARRASVIRTNDVDLRTILLLRRLRFHLLTKNRAGKTKPLLAEDQLIIGFQGSPEGAQWLPAEEIEPLLSASPSANIAPELAQKQVQGILDRMHVLQDRLDDIVRQRGEELLDAHRRVRQAAKQSVRALGVEPHLPADLLGLFVFLPQAGGGE